MSGKFMSPGIRFHPTDVELVVYYLKRKLTGKKIMFQGIGELNVYKFAPWDLPDKSCMKTGDLKWYFFCPREMKYACGSRFNRATKVGYWKTTGKDRPVLYNSQTVGMIKTLVFHQGKAPKGERTDWVMHEYRLQDKDLADKKVCQDAYVLCEIYQKSGMGPQNGAQYGAPFKEEEWTDDEEVPCSGEDLSGSCSMKVPCFGVYLSGSASVKVPSSGADLSGSASVKGPFSGADLSGSASVKVSRSGTDLSESFSVPVKSCGTLVETLSSTYELLQPPVNDGSLVQTCLLPTEAPQAVGDDILSMMTAFDENGQTKVHSSVHHAGIVQDAPLLPSDGYNGIFDELVDLGCLDELNEVPYNFSAAAYTLNDMTSTASSSNNIAASEVPLTSNNNFLELFDLSTPVQSDQTFHPYGF